MILPSNGLPGSIHSDVLSATPTTPEEITRLIEELKRRAKLAISSKRYPEAEVLYAKAIELLEGDDNKDAIAILYSNRSLCRYHLGKFSESKEDAELAVKCNGGYVKGHFRLGLACSKLLDFDGAVCAFEGALKVERNAALEKELEKAKKAQAEHRELMSKRREEEEKMMVDGEKGVKKVEKKRVEKSSKPNAVKKEEKAVIDNGNGTGDFSKSDHVRGYKIVNGKKTSFFHHEQTEEEKKLIGDITPKMIDSTQASTVTTEKGVSAWNSAGTWEEKDVTSWARESLKKSILAAKYEIPSECLASSGDLSRSSNDATIIVTEVKGLDKGHASVATVRGKRRNIFEFTNVELKWTVALNDADRCCGSFKFHDIDGTCDGEYDMEFSIDASTPVSAKHLLERFVKGDPDGLRGELIKAVNGWITLFQETHSQF